MSSEQRTRVRATLRHSRLKLGTLVLTVRAGPFKWLASCEMRANKEAYGVEASLACLRVDVSGRGGGTRTPNLRIWRPLLCQLSHAPLPCPMSGGDRGIRTPDLCDANAALSQLSYIPTA